MNIQKEFKLLVLPVIKGLPLLAAIVALAYFFAVYSISYMVPTYEASASVKLDNREHIGGDYSLVDEQKNSVSGSNFLTEVEFFKSSALHKKALQKLPFDLTYHRIGNVKKIELFGDCPFIIDYKILDSVALDQPLYLTYKGKGRFRIFKDIAQRDYLKTIKFNQSYTDSTTLSFRIRQNKEVLKQKPKSLRPGDHFSFTINSLEKLAESVNHQNFFVRPIDKEVFVVKLHYKHEVPEKSALFLNTLIDVFIEKDQENKFEKAAKNLDFIDRELARVRDELIRSEKEMANFRQKYGIVNPQQETEAMLRQLNEYDMSEVSIGLKELELQNIFNYLNSDKAISGFSPDFEMIKDEVFENTFVDLKRLELQKTKTLEKYPESSLEVQSFNKNIKDLKDFIFKSVEKKLSNIQDQRADIQSTINNLQTKFSSYPEKERRLVMLQRNNMLNEETYNFLTKKRTELAIANSSDLPLHQVIDYAVAPPSPVSPNRSLIIGASLFLALIFGLLLVFILNYFLAGVNDVSDVKESMDIPFLGFVNKAKNADSSVDPILNIYTNINKNKFFDAPAMITVSSLSTGEGKTFISEKLGRLLASYGKKVLMIDMNFESPKLKQIFTEIPEQSQLKDIPERQINKIGNDNLDFVFLAGEDKQMKSTLLFAPQTAMFLNEMKNNYDVVLIDTAAAKSKIDAAAAMGLSDLNLMVFRKGKSRIRNLKKCKAFIENYNIDNVHFVLNG